MKVLVFSNMYPTEDKPQFGIYVYNQVKILEEIGCECKVISLKSKGNKYLRYLHFLLRSLYYSLIKGKEYTIVHAHYAFPPGFFAMLHKMRFQSKMIITTHGSDINKMPDKSRLIARLIGKVLEASDYIVCVSENLKEKIMSKFAVDPQKTRVINMGVNMEVFYKMNDTREELQLPTDKKIVLFVGNFYKAKGVIDLIKAFKKIQLEDKFLILLGDSNVEEETTRKVAELIQNDQTIVIVPPQPQHIVAKYMNAADVFVLPSYSEGYSLVTYEAMATETLVIVNDIDIFDHLQQDTVLKALVGNIENLQLAIEESLYVVEKTPYIRKALQLVQNNSAKEKGMEIYRLYHE